jgi:N-methylhydantoinase B
MIHYSNSANAPTEIIELEHPLMVGKYALVQDSGGAGKYRGGVGITREITFLEKSSASVKRMRINTRPYGLFGGKDGSPDAGGVILSDHSEVWVSKDVKPGEKAYVRTSGGGGWGNPLERDTAKIEWDALNGYISISTAEREYGCILDSKTFKVDIEQTKHLRNKLGQTASKSCN